MHSSNGGGNTMLNQNNVRTNRDNKSRDQCRLGTWLNIFPVKSSFLYSETQLQNTNALNCCLNWATLAQTRLLPKINDLMSA